MLDSIDEIRTFLRIADENSLTAAARSLGLSVNAVSRRLSQLETRLGVTLAHRTTRRLTLTGEGTQLVQRCRRILTEVDEAEEELRPAGSALRGLVRLAVHPELLRQPTLQRMADLLEAHPELSLQVFARNAPVDPVGAGFDLAIWPGDVTLQSVVARRLAMAEWVLAASPGYIKKHGSPKQPRELAHHECLRALKTRSESTWILNDDHCRSTEVSVRGRFESDDTATLREAIYAGLGIGFRPRGDVLRESAAGRLIHVLPRWRYAGLPIHLVSPPGRMRLARVRAVASLLDQSLETFT